MVVHTFQLHLCCSTSPACERAHTQRKRHELWKERRRKKKHPREGGVSRVGKFYLSGSHGGIPHSCQLHSSAVGRWLRALCTMAARGIYKAQLTRWRSEVTCDWTRAKPLGRSRHAGGFSAPLSDDSSRRHFCGLL